MTEETADQRMRRMAKEYGIPYTPPATAAPAAPVQTQQPAPPAKKPSGGDGIMGLLGGRKQQIDEMERKAVKGYAQGGLINDTAEYWANDNAEFEKSNPSFGKRVVRAVNPATSFGSAVGAMHTAAGNGDIPGMAMAGISAIPAFGLMRMAPAAGAMKAAVVPGAGRTAAAVSGGAIADAAADEYQSGQHKRFSNGGKIKGPGTPTSDSIGGVVKETGEPIKVSTEERIVSNKQEQALMRIAEMLGFESVDAMFESMTGEPVGPTISGGKLAAATGMSPEDDPVKRGIDVMKSQLSPQQPAPTAQQVYAGVLKPSPLASNYVGTGPTDPDVNGRNAIAQPSGTVQRGIDTMKSQLNQTAAPMFADNAKASAAGEAHLQSLYPAGTFDKHANVTAAQPTSVKPAMGAEEAGIRAKNAAVMNGVQSAADPAALAALKAKSAAGILGAVVRETTMPEGSVGQDGRSIAGQKLITNVADGQKVVDDSAAALRDQQSNNPYWSPAAQLERMQRRRLMSETGSGVTDPNVQAAAQKSLGILGNPADNQLKQVQAQGITAQNESNALLADLQKKAIGGDQQALATLNALTGKVRPASDRFLTVQGGEEIGPDGMTKIRRPGGVFDAQSGQFVPMDQSGKAGSAQGPSFASKAELQAAIKAGKVKPGQTVMTPNGPMVVK